MIVINTQNVQFNFLFSRVFQTCVNCSGGVSEIERRELLVIVINTNMFNFLSRVVSDLVISVARVVFQKLREESCW